MMRVWVNGVENIGVAPLDRGLAYGDGVFATMQVANKTLLFLGAHLQRLQQGAIRLGFDWQVSSELLNLLQRQATSMERGCIKLLLTRGVGGRGYAVPSEPQVTEIVSLHAIPVHYKTWQQQGISLITSEVTLARQPRLAGIKHCNRLEQILIKSTPPPESFDDHLVLDTHNLVVESSMANIFLVKGKQIMTPVMSHCGVAGVMREQVIHGVLALGFTVITKAVPVSTLSDYESAFVTNSLLGIVDVTRINEVDFFKAQWTSSLRSSLDLTLY
ncbi:aminodeoxychorismate lyase [Shewanella surugensis]|uniref:Aminodeoxychorismate lyase n=1 Tax=Shewanella surugensis TaxID=212020 RepID=A0ABT0L6X2_9GAMM|nr:aminodeoxychorismate lyase [Shewanella surugensis]MCL1123451.1 aminodeoxychorismate lyase [Shewanella surugensis]